MGIISLTNRSFDYSRKGFQEVEVFSVNDLPAPIAGKHLLAANTIYSIKNDLTLSNSLSIGEVSEVYVVGDGIRVRQIVYTGAGSFIDINLTDFRQLSLNNLVVFGTGANTLLSVQQATDDGTGLLDFGSLEFFNFASLGSVTNISAIAMIDSVFALWSAGLTVTNSSITVTMDTAVFNPVLPGAVTAVTFAGAFNVISVSGGILGLVTNQSGWFFTPGMTMSAVLLNNVQYSSGGGGLFFAPGSLTQTDIRFSVAGNGDQADSVSRGAFVMESNTNNTVITTAGLPGDELGWETVNGTTIASAANERWTMSANATLTYNGLENATGAINVALNAARGTGGGVITIQAAVFKNGTRISNVRMTVDTSDSAIPLSLIAPFTAVTGDIFIIKVRNLTNTNDILVQDMQVDTLVS